MTVSGMPRLPWPSLPACPQPCAQWGTPAPLPTGTLAGVPGTGQRGRHSTLLLALQSGPQRGLLGSFVLTRGTCPSVCFPAPRRTLAGHPVGGARPVPSGLGCHSAMCVPSSPLSGPRVRPGARPQGNAVPRASGPRLGPCWPLGAAGPGRRGLVRRVSGTPGRGTHHVSFRSKLWSSATRRRGSSPRSSWWSGTWWRSREETRSPQTSGCWPLRGAR